MRKIFILTVIIITAFYLAYISQSTGNDDTGHAPWGSYAVSIRDAAPAPAALKTTIPNETPYSFLSFQSEHVLDIDAILQLPDYPTGCEIVSLAMALRYVTGEQLVIDTLIDDYLPTDDHDFTRGFIGNPKSADGGGCFPPVIVTCANRFFADNHMEFTAVNASGITREELYKTIDAGFPVLMWTTMYLEEPRFISHIVRHDGQTFQWYVSEHCLLVKGYDIIKDVLIVNDPLVGETEYDVDEFMEISDKIGNLAVTLQLK